MKAILSVVLTVSLIAWAVELAAEHAGWRRTDRPDVIVVQNYYYAKPGQAAEVYQWRLHASDVRVKLGFLRGRVLRNLSPKKDQPDVIWECEYPSAEAREREAAAVGAAVEFQAVQNHMSTLIGRFDRGTYSVASH